MLRIFIQDGLFSLHNNPPTRQLPVWFINVALKICAQLSISTAVFLVFDMTLMWFKLTIFRSGGERLYERFTLIVNILKGSQT